MEYLEVKREKKDVTGIEKVVINGVDYIRLDVVEDLFDKKEAKEFEGMNYCIIRTYSAGVFAGYIESRNEKEALLRKVRRLWYWEGACSLSQMAVDGPMKPDKCKFPVEVDKITVTEVIEVLRCTEKARLAIANVPVWRIDEKGELTV